MKKLLYLTLVTIFACFSCQKENLDDIAIDDFSFEADTLVKKSGFLKVEIDGNLVLDEPGYAFTCNATPRNEVNYMISNDFANSLAFFNHSSNPNVQISSSFRWSVQKEDKNSFILPIAAVYYKKDSIGYYSSPPVENENSQDTAIITKESILEFVITEEGTDFIRGTFKGTLKKGSPKEEPVTDEGRVVSISGEFDLPLYRNCEIGLPIGIENGLTSALFLPYNSPQMIGSHYIVCTDNGIQRNLISTVPVDFVQFDEAPQSLLQNEHDYYIYWEYTSTEVPSIIQEFECKINVNLPIFRGIAKLSGHQNTQFSPSKSLNLESFPTFIRSIGVLKTSESGRVLGVSSMIVTNSEINQLDCK